MPPSEPSPPSPLSPSSATADDSAPPPVYEESPPPHRESRKPLPYLPLDQTLRYHKRTALCLALYLPLLIIPWVATCVLDSKPMTTAGGPSYLELTGDYSQATVDAISRWYRAVRILNALALVLAVPVVSAVLSHAAVIQVQRRRTTQRLSVPEMLTLADAPWSHFLTPSPKIAAKLPGFVKLGYGLVFLAILQLVLQFALVVPETIRVASDLDYPYTDTYRGRRYRLIGYDPEPAMLAIAPSNTIVRRVASRMAAGASLRDAQTHLWPEIGVGAADDSDYNERMARSYNGELTRFFPSSLFGGDDESQTLPFFAAAFPPSTDTGVLRYHAMRLNSTAACEAIARDAYPETCTGQRPFTGEHRLRDGDGGGEGDTESLRVRWCSPGAYDTSPWADNFSRSRQDLAEEEVVFVDVFVPWDGALAERVSGDVPAENFTVRCAARTTRGYFELPSAHNGGQPGPLLTAWPSADVLAREFNDVLSDGLSAGAIPSESDPLADLDRFGYDDGPIVGWYDEPFDTDQHVAPGPLTTALLGALGNGSWFAAVQDSTAEGVDDAALTRAAYRSVCARGIPLVALHDSYSSGDSGYGTVRSACQRLAIQRANGNDTDTDTDTEDDRTQLAALTYGWFQGTFNDTSRSRILSPSPGLMAQDTLGAAMYFANEALLTASTVPSATQDNRRAVYTAPGTGVIKPHVPLAAMIIISILLLVEVVGLIAAAMLAYRVPTFASRLDAAAVATVGAQLAAGGTRLPRLGPEGRKAWREEERLGGDTDGLIGIRDNGSRPPAYTTTTMATTAVEEESRRRGSPQPRRVSVSSVESAADGAIPMVNLGPHHPTDATAAAEPIPSGAPAMGTLVVGAPGIISRRSRQS